MNKHQLYLLNLYKFREVYVPFRYHYLYQITNKINGKIYIGRRSTDTEPHLDDYMGSGSLLLKEISKYGIENFEKEICHICVDAKSLYALEASIVTLDWINRHKDICYNLAEGGSFGGRQSDSVRERMSSIKKAFLSDPEERRKNSHRQKEVYKNPEVRKRNSDAVKESHARPEIKLKMSISAKNRLRNPWNHNSVKLNPVILNAWKNLDKIYELYLKYDFSKRGEGIKWYKEVNSLFSYWPTPAMVSYITSRGDPSRDPDWVQDFK